MSGGDQWNDNEEFSDIIGLLREGPIDLTDETPGPDVWAGIADELNLTGVNDLSASPSAPATETLVERSFVVGDAVPSEEPGAAEQQVASNVVSMASRRPAWGRPAALLTLAAAVVLLLAVPVALSIRSGDDAELIAAADLQLLEGQNGDPASAEIVSIDGDLAIDVDSSLSAEGGEFLELWLLSVDGDDVETLSLGRVDGSGRYDVPDDVDLDRFSVVDISVELDDGNPDHSGNSVVRGELT